MREPKYDLNAKDKARWHDLLTRWCAELPSKPGGKVKLNPKFPALTAAERKEFERLDRKWHRRMRQDPRMKQSLARQRAHSRKLRRLAAKLKQLVSRL